MDIKDTALKHLASRARTCQEMRKYLKEKGFESEEIQQVIAYLEALHYLDDADYCVQYFDYAFGKGKGVLRIKRELEEKGIGRETIEIALEDYEKGETELERAEKQAAKIAEGRIPDQKLMGKIGRRLTALGYSSDIVYQVIGRYMRDQNN